MNFSRSPRPVGRETGPLSGSAKVFLMVTAAAIIVLGYAFFLTSILLLAVWILLEAAVFVVLLRFGLSGLLARPLADHFLLVNIFVKNLWLPKPVAFRRPLGEADAPELFGILRRLAGHFAIDLPDEVMVEMNQGAWVQLQGLHRRVGRTVLGVGFDLLATLNISEFEAVMAHEMAHARLVARGLKNWLNRGLARLVGVSTGLGEAADVRAARGETISLGRFFRSAADRMARCAARRVAAYSRQDEFEADRAAAELCGGAAIRHALLKLEASQELLGRIPWSERIGRAETEESFTRWLLDEVTAVSVPERELVEEAHDPYSTHPGLADRLAALPPGPSLPPNREPSIGLLVDADAIAGDLIDAVDRIQRDLEERDNRLAEKLARKAAGHRALGWSHIPAITLFFAAFFGLLVFVAEVERWWLLPLAVLLMGASFWSLRLARYRDRSNLPVPSFGALKRSWETPAGENLSEREKALKAEFQSAGWKGSGRVVGCPEMVQEAFRALGECDYLRAHVASGIALQMNGKSVEAASAHAIACAAFRMGDDAVRLLRFVQTRTAFTSVSTSWAAAWTLVLLQDWGHAEGFLLRLVRERPGVNTFLLLLAMTQKFRGKLHGAIRHAEAGVAADPGDRDAVHFLITCLLDAGRPTSAARWIEKCESRMEGDRELTLSLIRLRLLQGRVTEAAEVLEKNGGLGSSAATLVDLGHAFEAARVDPKAEEFFSRALALGYCPEAHFGMGRILKRRGWEAKARSAFLGAIDLEREVVSGANPSASVFPGVLAELWTMGRKRSLCRAWFAEFPPGQTDRTPPALRGTRFLVYGASRDEAVSFLEEVLSAAIPSGKTVPARELFWVDAPENVQPVRPVFAGVQGVFGRA